MAKGSIKLENVPTDVQQYILEIQGHEQASCLCKRSKEFTVYMLIREHRDMTLLKDPIKK